MSEQEEEKKNKTIAALTTAAIQIVVVLLTFLVVAWRPPDPPYPEYGMEVNFGLDDHGYGDVQPLTPVGNNGDQPYDAAKEDEQPQQEPEQPEQKQPEPKQAIVEEDTKPAPNAKEVEEQPVSKLESPVVVKEKAPEKPKDKVVEKQPEVKQPEVKVEKKPEPKVEKQPEVKEPPKEQPKAVYNPGNAKATGNGEGGAKAGTPGNHGDDPGTTGDKGNPEGKLDAKSLYGQPGNGGSGGLSMSGFAGFEWPKVQPPSVPDDALGVYEFIVRVAADGTVIKITPLKRGMSVEAQQRLINMIQELEFIPKGDNVGEAEGKITFKVVSK